MINDFDFRQPKSLPEALELMAGGGRIVPIAGGTNLMVNLKRAPLEADCVVDLTRIEEIRKIRVENGGVVLGAGVTFADLLAWRPGGVVEGLLRPMSLAFAGPLIRNLATVGGNVCDASPAADVSPPLLALDARVRLASAVGGERELGLEEFFQGVRKTARRSDEILVAVEFPRPGTGDRCFYYKLGKRKADAISIVSVAIRVRMNRDRVEEARVALGAVAPVAMRSFQAEELLVGNTLDDERIDAAALAAAEESRPIDDFRAGADYRRQMVETLIRRGLRSVT